MIQQLWRHAEPTLYTLLPDCRPVIEGVRLPSFQVWALWLIADVVVVPHPDVFFQFHPDYWNINHCEGNAVSERGGAVSACMGELCKVVPPTGGLAPRLLSPPCLYPLVLFAGPIPKAVLELKRLAIPSLSNLTAQLSMRICRHDSLGAAVRTKELRDDAVSSDCLAVLRKDRCLAPAADPNKGPEDVPREDVDGRIHLYAPALQLAVGVNGPGVVGTRRDYSATVHPGPLAARLDGSWVELPEVGIYPITGGVSNRRRSQQLY